MHGKTLPESHSQYSNAPAPTSHQTHTPAQREVIHLTALTLLNSQDHPFMDRLNTQHHAYKGVWNSTGLMVRKKAYRNLQPLPFRSPEPGTSRSREALGLTASRQGLRDPSERTHAAPHLSWLADALTGTVTQLVHGNKNNSCMFKFCINKTWVFYNLNNFQWTFSRFFSWLLQSQISYFTTGRSSHCCMVFST